MTDSWHLAQLNIARPRAPLDDPIMAEFMANLERINALGDASPGFVWRLQDDSGNATALEQPFGPEMIVNMTVWEDVEALRAFVFRSEHTGFLRRRAEWFDKLERPDLGAVVGAGRSSADLWPRRGRGSTDWPSWARRRRRSPSPEPSRRMAGRPAALWRAERRCRHRSASWSSASAIWGAAMPWPITGSTGFEIVGPDEPHIRATAGARCRPSCAATRCSRTSSDALRATRPDAVSINTYPDTHAAYALRAMDAGCHVFMEKPIATTVADAEAVVAKAVATGRKLVLGYILRVHPAWQKLVEIGRGLGKPLVMRMNLNQQSTGQAWVWHRNLMAEPDADRRLRRALCRRDVPADPRPTGPGPRHRRQAVGRDRRAELRPSARRVRGRLGRLVRGRLGADDVRGRVLR